MHREFNPARSLNCQARSCAILFTLHRRGLLQTAAQSPASLIHLLAET
ncbi:DarT1-associated NADAR antitoxin family protein [Luteolibacter arcticus]